MFPASIKRLYSLITHGKVSVIASLILVMLTASAALTTTEATDQHIYAAPEPGTFFTVEYTVSGPIEGVTVVKPLVTYTYIPISGTLARDQGWQSPNYTPYAISVSISTVNPSGYTLTCSIISGGQTRWSGELGAGQSSPTITVNGATTYVRILNQNSVTVSYTGTITLVNN
jgi:hypothetical protein